MAWPDHGAVHGAVALETTTSYFALAGRRPPTDPPQAWGSDGAFALTPGSHAATLADVDPDLEGSEGSVHATWFDGDLRVVPDDERHDEQVGEQFRIYRWDDLVFDQEIRLEVRRGMVVGEPYAPDTTHVITG